MAEENKPRLLQCAVINMDRGVWSAKLKQVLRDGYGYQGISDEDCLIVHCGCGAGCKSNATKGRCTCGG